MSINTAVGFVLKGDESPTIWLGFEYVEGFTRELAAGLAAALKNKTVDYTRAEAAGFIFLNLADFLDDNNSRFGLALSKPDGLTHTTHTVNLGQGGGVRLFDELKQQWKHTFTWKEFVERFGYEV